MHSSDHGVCKPDCPRCAGKRLQAFLEQREKVQTLEKELERERKVLQSLCTHKNLDGTNAYESTRGDPFPDCRLCGKSTYRL